VSRGLISINSNKLNSMKLILKQTFLYALVIVSISVFTNCNSKTSNQDETYGYSQKQIETLNASASAFLPVDRTKTIKIDLNDLFDSAIEYGSIIKKMNIIELESTNESLVGNIYNIIITDSRIYVEDDYLQGGVIIFDREGKFIHRIKNGNGPGELYMVAAIDFDHNTNELVVCQNRCMYYYDKDGNYLHEKITPFGTHDFKIFNGHYAFETLNSVNPQMQDISDNMFFQTDTTYSMINYGLPGSNFIGLASRHYLSVNEEHLLIPKPFNDTIFSLSDNKLSASYVLYYSDKKVPQSILDKSNSFADFYGNVNNSDYCFFIGDYREAGNIQAFRLSHFTKGDFLAYRNMKTGEITGGFRKNIDINQFPLIDLPFSTYKDYFITTISNFAYSEYCKDSKLLSKEDIAKIQRHKEEDNVLLVLYKVEL
jgi:hypothetical protein